MNLEAQTLVLTITSAMETYCYQSEQQQQKYR